MDLGWGPLVLYLYYGMFRNPGPLWCMALGPRHGFGLGPRTPGFPLGSFVLSHVMGPASS